MIKYNLSLNEKKHNFLCIKTQYIAIKNKQAYDIKRIVGTKEI